MPAVLNQIFDTMVSAEQSANLPDASTHATVIHFRGTHHAPPYRATLCEMADFIARSYFRRLLIPLNDSKYALPATDADSRKSLIPIDGIQTGDPETPASFLSLSDCPSWSGTFARSQGSHLWVFRRTTRFRRYSGGQARNRWPE